MLLYSRVSSSSSRLNCCVKPGFLCMLPTCKCFSPGSFLFRMSTASYSFLLQKESESLNQATCTFCKNQRQCSPGFCNCYCLFFLSSCIVDNLHSSFDKILCPDLRGLDLVDCIRSQYSNYSPLSDGCLEVLLIMQFWPASLCFSVSSVCVILLSLYPKRKELGLLHMSASCKRLHHAFPISLQSTSFLYQLPV